MDKTQIFGAAAALLLTIGSAQAFSDDAFGHGLQCKPRTLAGLYVFSASGHIIVSGIAQPKAIIELIRFNGDGTLTVEGATLSVNGSIVQAPAGSTGIYTLDADCRGSISFTHGPSFDVFVSPLGGKAWMIQTNPGNIFRGEVKRLSR